MKNIHNKLIIAIGLLALAGCSKDFLDRPPLDQPTLATFYSNEEDLKIATAALYGAPWFDFNDKVALIVGDVMPGNLSSSNFGAYSAFTIDAADARMNEAWRSLYRVVAHCNMNIIYIQENAAEDIPAEAINNALGELHFIRATAYFYLVQLWGPVPLILDNRELVETPMVNRHLVSDIYRVIFNDLRFAVNNLGEAQDPGRVNAWSAKGMLAKVFLKRAGLNEDGTGTGNGTRNQTYLDSAAYYAGDVCNNSGLSLMPEYGDLFKIANNNNEESLFALQWIASSTYGVGNSNQAYFAAESRLTGVGDGWGGANTVSPDLYFAYSDADEERRKATFMQNGDHYPELLQSEGGYLVEDTRPHIKKYIVGTPEDNGGGVLFLSTSMNTYMLRLADVYLIYAEALLGNSSSTSNGEALTYYNAVRERAGLDAVASFNLEELWHERRLELAIEGQYWYDILRQFDFMPEQTINKIASQDRGTVDYYVEADTVSVTSVFLAEPPTPSDFRLPYPAADVISNPLLNDPPIPYFN